MNKLGIGCFVEAQAGHDAGKCYVIFQMDEEYVYLVDGKIKTLKNPKKKKIKHIKILQQFDQSLMEKMKEQTVRDEEIKRAIKLLNYSKLSL